jgi:hypothetical protein
MQDLIEKAIAANASAEVIAALIAADAEAKALDRRKAFEAAVWEARRELGPVIKARVNTLNQSKYADFYDVARHVDPVLERHGLSYRFEGAPSEPGTVCVVCVLSHKDGHHAEARLTLPADVMKGRTPAQTVGSSSTYGQRYTLLMALGLATARDDDGRASGPVHAPITREQYNAIFNALQETDSSLGRFLALYGIEELEQLPASSFADAMRKIDAKRSRSNAIS